ncbi:MAG: NAD(P) transhydrogenase subunit alpha [Candidatus Pelagibacter sp. TMED273]|nr:MAG: NAD(P) transhydrogenase subunit alpha [Candidatus Pelagibacter sp. TMED273]
MNICSILENQEIEKRIALTPDIVKKYLTLGLKVNLQKNYATHLGIEDSIFNNLGANLISDAKEIIDKSDLIVQLGMPNDNQISLMRKDQTLVGSFNLLQNNESIKKLKSKNINIFSLELLPRITRAQSMDILSSQANLAGYKAVIESFANFEKAIPMMMTAAGTVPAAKVLVVGAGVAGLQAIATAKRMGAIVFATDVRIASKEQVESLGVKFVMVENEESKNAETKGGYAKEMSAEYQKKQEALLAETLKEMDIVICTAQIPGRKAPLILKKEMLDNMKQGSVIVDLAVESGGNCEYSQVGKVISKNGLKIVGHANVPGRVANNASSLFSKNVSNFLKLMNFENKKKSVINKNDEIIKATLICSAGKNLIK